MIAIYLRPSGAVPKHSRKYRDAAGSVSLSGSTPAFNIVGVIKQAGDNDIDGVEPRDVGIIVDLPGAADLSSNSLGGLVTAFENAWGIPIQHVMTVER